MPPALDGFWNMPVIQCPTENDRMKENVGASWQTVKSASIYVATAQDLQK